MASDNVKSKLKKKTMGKKINKRAGKKLATKKSLSKVAKKQSKATHMRVFKKSKNSKSQKKGVARIINARAHHQPQ